MGSPAAESDISDGWFHPQSYSGHTPPPDREVVRCQCVARHGLGEAGISAAGPPDRAGTIGGLFVGDHMIDFACPLLGADADHGRRLAADLAGGRLTLAELTHVAHRRG